MELREIRVGIADLNTAINPQKIMTVGLGSCIGIALLDKTTGIGGLAHIMLPDSKQFNNVTNPAKFADLAIPILVEKMEKLGATRRNIKAKIAGGAAMFSFSDKSMVMDIGSRNSESVKKVLKELTIPLMAEDVGGNKGRTIVFSTENGMLEIRTVGVGKKEI